MLVLPSMLDGSDLGSIGQVVSHQVFERAFRASVIENRMVLLPTQSGPHMKRTTSGAGASPPTDPVRFKMAAGKGCAMPLVEDTVFGKAAPGRGGPERARRAGKAPTHFPGLDPCCGVAIMSAHMSQAGNRRRWRNSR
jgi:hypothetical protein